MGETYTFDLNTHCDIIFTNTDGNSFNFGYNYTPLLPVVPLSYMGFMLQRNVFSEYGIPLYNGNFSSTMYGMRFEEIVEDLRNKSFHDESEFDDAMKFCSVYSFFAGNNQTQYAWRNCGRQGLDLYMPDKTQNPPVILTLDTVSADQFVKNYIFFIDNDNRLEVPKRDMYEVIGMLQ